ncbi:hypothetical protein [Rubneribacter sp.]
MITASQLSMLVLGLGLICVVSMALHMRHERTLKRVEALEQRSEELEASLVTLVARSTSAAPAPGHAAISGREGAAIGHAAPAKAAAPSASAPATPRDSVRAANPAPAPAR